MLTKNIDLKLGAPNGTNIIITKLEFDLENNVRSISINPLKYVQMVWKNQFKTNMILKAILRKHRFL